VDQPFNLYEAVVAGGALVLSYGFNHLFRLWAYRFRVSSGKSGNGEIRWNTRANPQVGGITFYLLFLLGFVFGSFVLESNKMDTLLPLLLIGSSGFLVGLVDDAFHTIPFLKLFGQLVTASLFLAFGIRFHLFQNEYLNLFLTLFWVVGIMNSFNMIDNMDGVSGSIALTLFLFFLFLFRNDVPDPWILSLLIGGILGFLILNWYPSKIFMGDSGSQFLGALIAYYGTKGIWQHKGDLGLGSLIPALFFYGLPFAALITDTLFVTVGRLLRGQPPYVGGRDHLSHCLAYLGLSPRWISILFASITLLGSFLYLSFRDHQFRLVGVFFYLSLWLLFAIPYRNAYRREFWLHITSKASKTTISR